MGRWIECSFSEISGVVTYTWMHAYGVVTAWKCDNVVVGVQHCIRRFMNVDVVSLSTCCFATPGRDDAIVNLSLVGELIHVKIGLASFLRYTQY